MVIEIEKPYLDKDKCIEGYFNNCNKKVDDYHNEYIEKTKGKTNKECIKIQNDINIRFSEEVVDFYLYKLDDLFDLPCDEFEALHKKSMDKLKDRIMYFSD